MSNSFDFLPTEGGMAGLIRQYDWASTPLGDRSTWSPSLRMMVRFILSNRFPHLLWWGSDYIQLYNDHYISILGAKHPHEALGKRFRECWHEVYDILQPMVDTPFYGGPSTWTEDIELIVERHGFPEESHFMFSYSATPDETAPRGIGGVLATVHEITEKVITERRVKILSELGASVAGARTDEEACAHMIDILSHHPKDVPFALIYLLDEVTGELRLAKTMGISVSSAGATRVMPGSTEADVIWPLGKTLETGKTQLREGLAVLLPEVPAGPWSDPPDAVAALPIKSPIAGRPYGVLVAGISACIRADDRYLDFLELLGSQFAGAVNNARAYAAERARAEALAEVDRAKTAFFANISHEFRTPLTLMLGPLEDALSEPVLTAAARTNLTIAQRNAQRLLRLVNSLLDFSRVEAGRLHACFEPMDIAVFTADLASSFHSAMDRAGLELIVETEALGEKVYVDRDMWEKIVLNLLSNAFKFTLRGRVEVHVYRHQDSAVLQVSDTGIGVPADEVPRLFERFHRVEGTKARTHEGSGIGLALVQELVKLHGGSIEVDSTLGEGTTFSVYIPFGCEHLPAGKMRAPDNPSSPAGDPKIHAQEAMGWLPQDEDSREAVVQRDSHILKHDKRFTATFGSRVLIADDNADMRHYLGGLLGPLYEVETAADGIQALEVARHRKPDLVLADVMMPNLDGFELLKAMRADPALEEVPLILLSARAGDEARIEGFEAGADDYIVKPFHARELLARVGALLELTALRHEHTTRFRAYVEASSDVIYRMNADWTEMTFLEGRNLIADQSDANRSWLDKYIPAEDQELVSAAVTEAICTAGVLELEHRIIRKDGSVSWAFSRAVPLFGNDGIVEWFGTASDISERKQLEQVLRDSEQRLRAIIEQLPAGVGVMDRSGKWVLSNALMERYVPKAIPSVTPDRLARWRSWDEDGNLVPPERWPGQRVLRGETIMPGMEMLYTAEDGAETWLRMSAAPLYSHAGEFIGASVVGQDITKVKSIEQSLREADRRKDQFLATLAHELRNPLAPIVNGLHILQHAGDDAAMVSRTYEMLDRQVNQMVRLVDDLMEVSRITGGKVDLRKIPVALSTLLQNALETSRPLIDAAHHRLTLILPGEPLMLEADPLRFAQVITNLLNNAAKYTDDGGHIWLSARREGSNAVISVRDNGTGIPAAMLPRVFDLFTQVERTTNRAQGGLGIGLTLVRSLVEMHDGSIEVKSEGPGMGSEFLIRIPLLPTIAQPGPDERKAETIRTIAPHRILVVDDNRDAADSLGMLLDLLGAEVRITHDGLTALETFESWRPNVVLMDIGMPVMDGYELARRIRRHASSDAATLVALTGWGQDEERRQSREAGIDHHLIKPVDISVLERLLAGVKPDSQRVSTAIE